MEAKTAQKPTANDQKQEAAKRIPLKDQVTAAHPDWNDEQVTAEVKRLRQRERRERFEVVGVRRTRQALKALKGLENVGNPNVYDYREDEVAKILNAVDEAVTRVHNSFKGITQGGEDFTL